MEFTVIRLSLISILGYYLYTVERVTAAFEKGAYTLIGLLLLYEIVGFFHSFDEAAKTQEESNKNLYETSTSTPNQTTNVDLKEIGDIKLTGDIIEFDQFMKLYKINAVQTQTQLKEAKEESTQRRRKAYKDGNIALYENIIAEAQEAEEIVTNSQISANCRELGITPHNVTESTVFYGSQEDNNYQMMMVMADVAGEMIGERPLLQKEKMISAYQKLTEIQFEGMGKLLDIQEELEMGAATEEAEKVCMRKMQVQQTLAADKLFEQTGVDEDFLSLSIKKSKLNEDPEFQKTLMASADALQERMKQREEDQ